MRREVLEIRAQLQYLEPPVMKAPGRWRIVVILFHTGRSASCGALKKTISLPPELAREAEQQAAAEGKTLSAVIQEALRAARAARLKGELKTLRGYWQRKAREKGILSQRNLERYLGR